MDDGSAFCERCGLDSDRLGSAGASDFRVCPDCSSSTCANCWNQVAGRCLACSPFHLSPAPGRTTRRIVPPSPTARVVEAKPARPAGDARTASRRSLGGRVAAAEAGVAAGAGRLARRGLSRTARIFLVGVLALAVVAGVRAVTVTGGAVAAQDRVEVETLRPEAPLASDPAAGLPEASVPAAEHDPSEPPAERHHGSGTSTSTNGGGSSGGGGNGGNGGGGATPGATPSTGPTGTPGPRGTPIPTPEPTPTDAPTPTPTDEPTPTPTDSPEPTPPPTEPPSDPPTESPTESP